MKVLAYVRSIYFTIGGLFSFLLIFSIATTVLYSDYHHNQFSVKLGDHLVEKVGTIGIDKTMDYLEEASHSARLLKNRLSVDNELLQSPKQLEKLMAGILMTHPHLYSCYIGLEDGHFYQVRRDRPADPKSELVWRESYFQDDHFMEDSRRILSNQQSAQKSSKPFDPRQRLWYKQGTQEKRLVITEAYVFNSINALGITIAIPLYHNDKQIGVAGVDITLQEIGGFLAKLKLGADTRAFIVNAKQKVIAHPEGSVFRNKDGKIVIPDLVNVESKDLQKLYLKHHQKISSGELRRGHVSHEVIAMNDMEYVVVLLDFVGLHGVSWTLMTYAPVNYFMGPISQVRLGIAVMTAFILLFAIGLCLLLSRYIATPIHNLARKAERSAEVAETDFMVETKIPELKVLSSALQNMHRGEAKLLEVSQAISAEIKLQPLLGKVMQAVTDILDADRSTLFLYDERTDELWSKVAEGVHLKEIRFSANSGIAGLAFSTGEKINIQDAYNDNRFNQDVDKLTGYKTTSILCMQIVNKQGKPIGAVQALNKRDGVFTAIDEHRLRAFSAQAVIAIENAQLFNEVVTIKNYNEAMLESMTNGILTTDQDGRIAKANYSALSLLGAIENPEALLQQLVADIFDKENTWISQRVHRILQKGGTDESLDASLILYLQDKKQEISINLLIQPLTNSNNERIGCLMMFEDISSEKRLRSTMARYMTKELADKLIDDGEQALGGSLQVSTVLFSDIRSFTSFSERNGPQETVRMLNAYFTEMYEQIIENRGILDKYIGDAIMAVFGAPFASPQDADNAVQTAIGMVVALRVFNQKRIQNDQEPIAIGIGINTGEVVSGNIGSEKRMDYTVIGDGVNLAARLEGATKAYSTSILISGFTKDALTKPLDLREVDWIQVKGKKQPVAIYEVLTALQADERASRKQTLTQHQQGLACYRQKKWVEALELFGEIQRTDPQDPIAEMYVQRSRYFLQNPPGDSWNGVWVMKSK